MEDAVSKGGKVTIGGKKPDLPEPYNKVCHALPYLPPRHLGHFRDFMPEGVSGSWLLRQCCLN